MLDRTKAETRGHTRFVTRADVLAWIVLALAAVLAALPLLTRGYSCGHDFDFHLRSWMEVSTQWKSGIIKPVWAFHAAWDAGEPRFLFYPPLSWITGALLTLVLPWSSIAFSFTALVLFLSGVTMHRLLRRWVSPGIAIFGGCLYLVNPYMLFCAYERTAYAELMAAAWMPLLLIGLLRERVTAWRIAVAIALLWITNAPAAVVGCYSMLLIGGMRMGEIPGTGHLERVVFNANWDEIRREMLLVDLRQRIRDVRQGPDELLYVLTDEDAGAILRIEPAS